MTNAAPAVDVLFVVLPGTLLLDLAGPAEAFRLANQALARRGRPPVFRLRYAGPAPQAMSSVGVPLVGLEPLPPAFERSTWVVLLGRAGDAAAVVRRERPWLATRDWLSRRLAPMLAPGADTPHRLFTVCAGALLAADAGLIGARRATTHHDLVDALARLAPAADVLANRLFVLDGPLASSAGITAGIDLALHAIGALCGDAVASDVAQTMVAFARRGADAPQRSPLLQYRQHLHPAVHRVQQAVCEQPGHDWNARALAEVAHVTPRHLGRLFRRHAGITPRDYVEHVRAALTAQALRDGARTERAAELGGFRSSRQWRRARRRMS